MAVVFVIITAACPVDHFASFHFCSLWQFHYDEAANRSVGCRGRPSGSHLLPPRPATAYRDNSATFRSRREAVGCEHKSPPVSGKRPKPASAPIVTSHSDTWSHVLTQRTKSARIRRMPINSGCG